VDAIFFSPDPVVTQSASSTGAVHRGNKKWGCGHHHHHHHHHQQQKQQQQST